MASLTVRKLDEDLKAELRLRAARNGRSVEDEVRMILRDAAFELPPAAPGAADPSLVSEDSDVPPPALSAPGGRQRLVWRCARARRLHRRLQVARPDPAAEGAEGASALRADIGGAAVHHPAQRQRAGA